MSKMSCCKIKLKEHTELSSEDDDNQNNQNYSETVSTSSNIA